MNTVPRIYLQQCVVDSEAVVIRGVVDRSYRTIFQLTTRLEGCDVAGGRWGLAQSGDGLD